MCLQAFLKLGSDWRIWVAFLGMCQIRQPLQAGPFTVGVNAVGKVAVNLLAADLITA